jgi:hypothetical protein
MIKEMLSRAKNLIRREKMSLFVLYSGATDVTGPIIADKLGASHGKDLPTLRKGDVVISWGAKLPQGYDYKVLDGVVTVNHPKSVKLASNKLEAMNKFKLAGIKIPSFMPVTAGAEGILAEVKKANGTIKYPIIGRTKRHQGGTGFFLCIQPFDVKTAVENGAMYFVNHVPIKKEFRLHVFDGKVIDAKEKVPQSNPLANWVNEEAEDILDKLRKNTEGGKAGIDKIAGVVKFALEQVANTAVELPDTKIRSNHRGWKFVNAKSVSEALKQEAVNAVKALDLVFGAVDCVESDDGKIYIIEVNTGPGLKTEGTLNAYLEAINAYVSKSKTKKPSAKTAIQDILGDLDDDEANALLSALSKISKRAAR